jgi:hypothetical protein
MGDTTAPLSDETYRIFLVMVVPRMQLGDWGRPRLVSRCDHFSLEVVT